jgi:small nuclear ribonucleoprotein (snRNP)-like protein
MTNPLNLLEKSLQKTIMLVLKDGRIIEGKLTGFDTYMNMVLDDTDENFEEKKRKLGTVILRGNNVVSITPK